MIYNQTELEKSDLEKEYKALSRNYSEAECLEIFPEARPYLKMKLGFLKKQAKELQIEILHDLSKVYFRNYPEGKNDFSRWFSEEIVRVFKGGDLNKLQKQIQKLKFLLNPPKEIKGHITPVMIEKAKQYDFSNLIQFNRAGFAICPFHSEKSPSLHFNKRKNKVHCFGACGKSWDIISYLMESERLEFKEAVLKLQ